MAYTLIEKDHLQILTADDLWNPEENQVIISAIEELIKGGKKDIIVDMVNMPYMNSTGLSFLISILTRARSAGGDVVIANISEKIQQILLMTRLQSMFTLTDSLDQAIESFQVTID